MTQGTLFKECEHLRCIVVPEKRGPHHARLICSDCGKFMGWMPKPETVERQKNNALILAELAKIYPLTEWERGFIRDLVTHKNISPKQQDKLLLLRDKYLMKGGPPDDSKHGEEVP
jgi:hypothetical protein